MRAYRENLSCLFSCTLLGEQGQENRALSETDACVLGPFPLFKLSTS